MNTRRFFTCCGSERSSSSALALVLSDRSVFSTVFSFFGTSYRNEMSLKKQIIYYRVWLINKEKITLPTIHQ